MAYQKLQVSRGLVVIPSNTIDIPFPGSEILTGVADFSVAGTLTDVGTAFTTAGIEQNAIVYNTTAQIAYYVTNIASDTALSLSPSSAGGATDAYKIYNAATVGAVLYIGTTGTVDVITSGGDTVLFTAVPVGMFMPVEVTRVLASSGASTIVALW